jgi:tetraacyldisaccharide 4'-kinase
MISRSLPETPVWVGGNRTASGRAALEHSGAGVLVIDDGFQHLSLDRDLDIVLLDCRNPFGNGFVMPAGPLREPASSLHRADALLITHAEEDLHSALLRSRLESLFPGKPVFACRHQLTGISLREGECIFNPAALSGRKAVAFAGIAGAQGFFEDLQKTGIRICEAFGFPDHHGYTEEDFSKVFGAASKHAAQVIITTAKDHVRLPPAYRQACAVAELGIDFSGPDLDGFCNLIASVVSR